MTVLEKYNRYLAEPTLSDEYREQLKHLTSEEINDAFYRDLEFGTAGMRGLLGPGSNRLNIFVIRKATVGFSLYLLSKFGSRAKTNGVVISHDNRLFSREFAIEAARTLSSYGIKAHFHTFQGALPSFHSLFKSFLSLSMSMGCQKPW